MARMLSSDEIRDILQELVDRLANRGSEARIYVVGGAAIALANPERTTTRDIDGYVRLTDASEIIAQIQAERGLEAEWFNDHAQGCLPPVAGAGMWHLLIQSGDVSLFVANSDALLAMKLNAARAKDTADIAFLLKACEISAFTQAEAVFEQYYPGDGLTPTAIERLKFALAEIA